MKLISALRREMNKRIVKIIVVLLISLFSLPLNAIDQPLTVKAAKKNALDLAGCSPTFSDELYSEDEGVYFRSFEVTNGGQTIKISVTLDEIELGRESEKEDYVFRYDNYDTREKINVTLPPAIGGTGGIYGIDPSGGGVAGTTKTYEYYYVYKGPYNSTLDVRLSSDDKIEYLKIEDYESATNNNFKKVAQLFNEKFTNINNLSNRSCSQASLFGRELDARISFHGIKAPTIDLAGSEAKKRPKIRFLLKYAFNKGGAWTINDDMFIFEATEILESNTSSYNINDYKNLVIVLVNSSEIDAFPARCGDLTRYNDCSDYRDTTKITINTKDLWLFFNHVYNSQPETSETTCGPVTSYKKADDANPNKDTELANWTVGIYPPLDCLNVSPQGWLKKWGVITKNVSVTNPTGEESSCGNSGVNIFKAIMVGFCSLTIMFRDWATSFLCFAQNKLGTVLGQQGITGGTCDSSDSSSEIFN